MSVQLLSLHAEGSKAFDAASHHEFLLLFEIDFVVVDEDSFVCVDNFLGLATEELLLIFFFSESIFLSLRDGDLLFLFDLLHVLFTASHDEYFRLIRWLVLGLPGAQVEFAADCRGWSFSLWLVLTTILTVATFAGIPLNTNHSQTKQTLFHPLLHHSSALDSTAFLDRAHSLALPLQCHLCLQHRAFHRQESICSGQI